MLLLVTSNKLSAKLLILIFSDIVGNFSLTTSADDVMIFIFSLECPFDDFFICLASLPISSLPWKNTAGRCWTNFTSSRTQGLTITGWCSFMKCKNAKKQICSRANQVARIRRLKSNSVKKKRFCVNGHKIKTRNLCIMKIDRWRL